MKKLYLFLFVIAAAACQNFTDFDGYTFVSGDSETGENPVSDSMSVISMSSDSVVSGDSGIETGAKDTGTLQQNVIGLNSDAGDASDSGNVLDTDSWSNRDAATDTVSETTSNTSNETDSATVLNSDRDSELDDGVSCTDYICNDSGCENVLKANYCLIGGRCVRHAENDSDNECQYCDVVFNNRDWTKRDDSVACDDGLWCNGADRCDGAGGCTVHEFPDGTRCAGGAICENTCNEDEKTCFSESETVCNTRTEYRCKGSGCGDVAEARNVITYCTGVSGECDGFEKSDSWAPILNCGADEICVNAGAFPACKTDFACQCTTGGNWYDSENNNCWQNPPSSAGMDWEAANDYCKDADWSDLNQWELPDMEELISITRGCVDGTATGDASKSVCSMEPPGCVQSEIVYCDLYSAQCDECIPGSGLDDSPSGCYWVPELSGDCEANYWSSTEYVATSNAYYFSFDSGGIAGTGFSVKDNSTIKVRCVQSNSEETDKGIE